MSDGKALFPVIARHAFSRLSSWMSGNKRGSDVSPSNNDRTIGRRSESNLFRAIERFGRDSGKGGIPSPAFVAIAEVHRFSLLRRQVGHSLANRLMAALAERIQKSCSAIELGRVGRTSVEFVFTARSVLLAEEKLRALTIALEHKIDLEGYQFQLPVVIGAAEIGTHPVDEALIDRAAAAVTEAQEANRKIRVVGQDSDSAKAMTSQLDMMRDLRWAMVHGGLELHYQPKLRARTNTICSVEALLRWTHADHGPVPTDKFVSIAETSGAIYDLTRWVIERAIGEQGRLVEQGYEVSLYINLSGALVANAEFCSWAIERLTAAQGKFGFEITETAVIDDPDCALANLRKFAEAGILIAIDDYGSGLSSLAYLKQLPANELKIDRLFISDLTNSHRDPLLVRSSIDLAHALEMDVTAEGVADAVTLSLLRVMGCDLIQGYLISHPLPLVELIDFLANHADDHAEWGLPMGTVRSNIDATAIALQK